MPDTLVFCVAPVIEPPPDATENVTVTPLTGFPFASVTFAEGGVATAVPGLAD
jgi:hypothetical protein